jgi:hypothetical protein
LASLYAHIVNALLGIEGRVRIQDQTMVGGVLRVAPCLQEGRVLGWWFLREYVDGGTCQFPALKCFGYRFSVRYGPTGGVNEERTFAHQGKGSVVDQVFRFISSRAV